MEKDLLHIGNNVALTVHLLCAGHCAACLTGIISPHAHYGPM